MSIAKAISFGSLTSENVDKISWIILEFTMFTSEIVIIGVWNMKIESHKYDLPLQSFKTIQY